MQQMQWQQHQNFDNNTKLATKCLRKEFSQSVFATTVPLVDSISVSDICNTCNCQSPFSVPLFESSSSLSPYYRLTLNDNNQNWLLCLPFPNQFVPKYPVNCNTECTLHSQSLHLSHTLFPFSFILLFIFIAIFVRSHCPLYYTLFLLCCHQ